MNDYAIFMTEVYDELEPVTDFTEGTITKDKQNKFKLGIAVNGDATSRNFILDPYFKVFIGDNPDRATKIARIAINRPEYIIHYKNASNIWFLTSKEKKNLINLLKSSLNNRSDDGKPRTVWDDILLECTKEFGDEMVKLDIDRNEFLIKKMPDYMQLEKK